MSESKISCPHCNQHVVVDDAWGGQSLNCPACQQTFMVPQAAAAPAPAGARLSQPTAPPPPPPAPRPQSARPAAASQPTTASRTSGLAIASLVLSLTGCLSLGGVICGHLARRQMRRDPSVGGNGLALTGLILGYIGVLLTAGFLALAAYGFVKGREFAADFEKEMKAAVERGEFSTNFSMGDFSTNGLAEGEVELPDDPVGGQIVGVPFDYFRSKFNPNVGTLAIEEGEDFIADQSVLIFLFPKPGESLANRTWKVTAATPTGGRPHIHLRWLKDDGAPGTTVLTSGYTLDLTTGDLTNGCIAGKLTLKAGGKFPVNLTGEFNAKVE